MCRDHLANRFCSLYVSSLVGWQDEVLLWWQDQPGELFGMNMVVGGGGNPDGAAKSCIGYEGSNSNGSDTRGVFPSARTPF